MAEHKRACNGRPTCDCFGDVMVSYLVYLLYDFPATEVNFSRLILSTRVFNMESSSMKASATSSTEQEPLNRFGHANDDTAFTDYSYNSASIHDEPVTKNSSTVRTCTPMYSMISASWKLEFLCCSMAVVLFLVVVFILYLHNGQELSSWKAPVAMSSLLSFISSAIRGLLSIALGVGISQLKWHHFEKTKPASELVIYDEASRNVFGIFELLKITRE